jgi:hypothetical protein
MCVTDGKLFAPSINTISKMDIVACTQIVIWVLFCIVFAKGHFENYMLHERLRPNSSLSHLNLRLYCIRPVVDELAVGQILLQDNFICTLLVIPTFLHIRLSLPLIGCDSPEQGAPYCVLGLYSGASSLAST